jgi:hypothetical protein
MFRNLLIRAVAFGAALRYSPPPLPTMFAARRRREAGINMKYGQLPRRSRELGCCFIVKLKVSIFYYDQKAATT